MFNLISKTTSLCLSVATLLLTIVHANAQDTNASGTGRWLTFESAEHAIQYPDTFSLDTTSATGAKFAIMSAPTSPTDKFAENMNLLIQDLQGYGLDLTKYVELTEGQVRQYLTNGKILESKRMKKTTGEFHFLSFDGEQGVHQLRFIQYCWIRGEKAFVLTFTAERAQYDKYKDVAMRMMDSFVIK